LIGHPLANRAGHGPFGAGGIINAECCALFVPEVKLAKVALQVLLADVVLGATDAAL
jgi:hypothetical protein